jgi:hypothetical protein
MMNKKLILILGSTSFASLSSAQVPDLLNSLDAGSRSMGAGGAFGVTSADTFSILNNPAGLGFMSTRTAGLSYRNLPTSKTTASGTLSNPTLTTDGDRGKNKISHLGYAMPMKNGMTIGLSYQIGGFIDDLRTGTNLTSGAFNNVTYNEQLRVQTDFYTIAMGKANAESSRSFGYGITIANTSFSNQQLAFVPGAGGGQGTLLLQADNQGMATGVGLVAGFQVIPKSNPNTTYGLSVRTPIKLTGNTDVTDTYRTIPGQVSLGLATRIDNFRGKEDYLIYGLQLSRFFGGSGNGLADRDQQTVFGAGVEYNVVRDDATIPVRFGYIGNGKGGNGFSSRDAFTLGFGYRRAGAPWSLDLNYAYPRGGSADFAMMLNYRFEK